MNILFNTQHIFTVSVYTILVMYIAYRLKDTFYQKQLNLFIECFQFLHIFRMFIKKIRLCRKFCKKS